MKTLGEEKLELDGMALKELSLGNLIGILCGRAIKYTREISNITVSTAGTTTPDVQKRMTERL